MRVVLHASSMANPFLDAWTLTLLECAQDVFVMLESADVISWEDIPAEVSSRTIVRKPGESDQSFCRRVENRCEGEPDVIFYWWGIQALGFDYVRKEWPNAHVSLCVDTYPNASVLATEWREQARAFVLLKAAHSLVVTSEEMYQLLRRRIPLVSNLPYCVVHTPFPLRSHCSHSPSPTISASPQLCFTGRSDYLAVINKRMAKDNVSDVLEPFIAEGADVHVQRPRSLRHEHLLKSRGYKFYDLQPRRDITSGKFSEFISSFAAHLVFYSTPNATLRRRVSTGLSTRFAVGLTSSAPMLIPRSATFARRFFSSRPVGFASGGAARSDLDTLLRNADQYRQNWSLFHKSWSGEASVAAVVEMWSKLE